MPSPASYNRVNMMTLPNVINPPVGLVSSKESDARELTHLLTPVIVFLWQSWTDGQGFITIRQQVWRFFHCSNEWYSTTKKSWFEGFIRWFDEWYSTTENIMVWRFYSLVRWTIFDNKKYHGLLQTLSKQRPAHPTPPTHSVPSTLLHPTFPQHTTSSPAPHSPTKHKHTPLPPSRKTNIDHKIQIFTRKAATIIVAKRKREGGEEKTCEKKKNTLASRAGL